VIPWPIQDWQLFSNSGAFSASMRPATARTTLSPTCRDAIVMTFPRIVDAVRGRQPSLYNRENRFWRNFQFLEKIWF
jgi:hypothetical protein